MSVIYSENKIQQDFMRHLPTNKQTNYLTNMFVQANNFFRKIYVCCVIRSGLI